MSNRGISRLLAIICTVGLVAAHAPATPLAAAPCLGAIVVVLQGSPSLETPDITVAADDFDGQGVDLGDTCGLTIYGNDAANNIIGSPGIDTIYGYGGDDVIFGGPGGDIVSGGSSNDQLWGGSANDSSSSQADGGDALDGGAGDDVVMGGNDNDAGAIAGDGDDVLSGGEGNDTVFGGNRNVTQAAGADGNDALDGGNGDDHLFGGNDNAGGSGDDGNDTLTAGSGVNTLYGGNNNTAGGTGADNASGGGDTIDAVNGYIDDFVAGGSSDAVSAGSDTIRFEQAEVDRVQCDTDDQCEPNAGSVTQGGYTFQGGVPQQAGSPIGPNQSTLVLYVRASDDATANLTTLRTNEEAEFGDVQRAFTEMSFSQISFSYTHSPASGWYQLPRTYDDYMWTAADITAAAATTDPNDDKAANDGQNLLQDATGFFTDSLQQAWSDSVSLSSVSQVVVVIIGPFHRGTSYGPSNYTVQDADGTKHQFTLPTIIVSTNTGWSRSAHEFGHAFGGFADLYLATTRRVGNWDIMDCTDCGSQTTGWHKDKAGWYGAFPAAEQILTRPTGADRVDVTTTLIPYETAAPGAGVQTIRLDVGGDKHLYIENRQELAGAVTSQNLPGNGGVIITDGDTASTPLVSAPILLFGGPLDIGEEFTDESYGNLTVSVAADPASTLNRIVTVGWGADPYFDLKITPWSPPPWESNDIWIDSPDNGFGTFEFTDSSGQPTRNGDRPRVGMVNHLFARITNEGNVAANNVRVAFYATDPAGIGDSGNWTLIDRVTIASIGAGGVAVTPALNWTPPSSGHTCIIARIEHQTGELNANNNEAQENINDFDTTSNSPWQELDGEVVVTNPTDRFQDMRMEITDLPAGWTASVSDRIVPLAPSDERTVSYHIDPGDGTNAGVCLVDVNVVGYVLAGESEVPLGGLTAAVHLIHPADLVTTWFDDNPPEHGEGEQPSGSKMGIQVLVNTSGDPQGLPVTVVLVSSVGEEWTATGTTDSTGQVEITLDQFAGATELRPGEAYRVKAEAGGSSCVQASGGQEIEVEVPPGTTFGFVNLDLNTRSQQLQAPLAYCAVSFAVNYELLQGAFAEWGHSFSTSVVDPLFDLEKARQCLDELGGSLNVVICFDVGQIHGPQVAEIVAEGLSSVGIGVNVEGMDSATLTARTEDGSCDIVIRVPD